MKIVRFSCLALLVFGLVLSFFAGSTLTVQAADADIGDHLAKILGVSASELRNYATNYKNSLPIDYIKDNNSHYVAIGGVAARGDSGISNWRNAYTEQIAKELGISYKNVGKGGGLTAADAVDYVTDSREAPTEIAKADLITFQIDGATFIEAAVSNGTNELPWTKYITDAALLADIENFCKNMANEYTTAFGAKNAELIAKALECMLYESVVYSHETIKAVQAIRASNSDAVILVLGLYNPLRGLSLTVNGQTIQLGNMVESMISVCNAYLLKQTKDLKNTAFVDISAASTKGFTNTTCTIDQLGGELQNIMTAVDKQYANQDGHDYIRAQVLNAAKAPCPHTTTTIVGKKAASCAEKGYTGDTVCADCQKTITKGSETPITNHTYGAWTQTKAPTCTEQGVNSRSCTGCTKTETQPIAAKGHAWDNGTVTKAPTCKVTGIQTFSCANCTDTRTETIDTVAHAWDNGTVTKEPTCKVAGVKTFSCATCTDTKTESIAKVAHAWDNGTVTKEPTCKVAGVKTFSCATCTDTKTESIAALPHAWDNGAVTKEPTCKVAGVKTFTCATCSGTKTESIATLPHTWDNGAVTKEPSCGNEGTKTFTCTTCSGKKTEAIAALTHAWDNGTVTQEPTCEAAGIKTFTCANCNATNTEAMEPLVHAWDAGSVTQAPTCDVAGVKTFTCTNCNASKTESIGTLDHDFGEYISDQNATCQADGTKTATCQNCGAQDTVTDPSTRIAHAYADGICTFCGAAEPTESSDFTWVIVVSVVVVAAGGAAGFWFYKKKTAVK